MPGRFEVSSLQQDLADVVKRRPEPGIHLYWLEQAGFVIDANGHRMVIDAYLSDSLAEKYRGTSRPHVRMVPPPVSPGGIFHVDLVLCTHAHTDHMDPGTLKPLLAANPSARLVAPRSMLQSAIDRSGVEPSRIVSVNAGESLSPLSGISLTATASAHEELEVDERGDFKFLGYLLDAGSARIWHSGDCVPYPHLAKSVHALAPNIALLPVNGRRAELSDNGVPGNFEIAEAIELTLEIGATVMLAHHYGLFSFNTANPKSIDDAAAGEKAVCVMRAKTGLRYSWVSEA